MEPESLMQHSRKLSNNPYPNAGINPIPRIDIYFFKVHSKW